MSKPVLFFNFAARISGSAYRPVRFREIYPSLSECIQAGRLWPTLSRQGGTDDDVFVLRDTALWRLAGLLAGHSVNIELLYADRLQHHAVVSLFN